MTSTTVHRCKSCKYSIDNSSTDAYRAGHYCSEQLGSDKHYTWGTPMFMDMESEVWDACSNQMALSEPDTKNGVPQCYGFTQCSYSLTVAGDIGNDNGIFDGGTFSTVEDAIAYEDKVFAYKYHEFYGAYVKDQNGTIVAESNGYWGDHETNWHCPVVPKAPSKDHS